MAAGIADGSGMDAFAKFPELAFRAPEAAEPEHRLLQPRGIGRLQPVTIDVVACCGVNRLRAAGQRFGCAWQRGRFAHEKHGLLPGWIGLNAQATERASDRSIYASPGSLATPGRPATRPAMPRSGQFRE
jgi:hypothetical protein